MKKHYILFILLLTSCSIFAQTLQPTETEALLFMLIVDKNDQPISEEVVVISKTNQQVYKTKSNTEGLAEVLIPINDTYSINLKGEPNYDEIIIPNQAMYGLQYKIFYDKKRGENAAITTVNYTLKTEDGKPLSEEVFLKNTKTGEKSSFVTDRNGAAQVKLKNNTTYEISYESVQNYDVLTLSNEENLTFEYNATYNGSFDGAVYPNRENTLFNFLFLDLDSMPVANERFYLQSQTDNKTYTAITDKNGKTSLLVPIGNVYTMNAEHFENFGTKNIAADQFRYTTNVILQFISTPEYEYRKAEKEREVKSREEKWNDLEALYQAFSDSLSSWLNVDVVRDMSTLNPEMENFEAIKDSVVTVVLGRNNWQNPLIIADVTGSMHPYNDQLRIWYRKRYEKNNAVQFVFFNDGDNKIDNHKLIGETGGLYHCTNCNLSELADTMRNARQSGDGGDVEENDLEGVIEALNTYTNYSDIILIADNLSDVRDMKLLTNINQPIHIILCSSNKPIHEDYINIAYQTGGMIHTFREDINIRNRLKGVRLEIGTDVYLLTRGKFVRYIER